MTNNVSTKQHINIKKGENVSATSLGKIQGTTWQASDGYARQQEIEEARKAALAEYQARSTTESRLEMIEGAIADLQKKYEELKNG